MCKVKSIRRGVGRGELYLTHPGRYLGRHLQNIPYDRPHGDLDTVIIDKGNGWRVAMSLLLTVSPIQVLGEHEYVTEPRR